MMAKPDTFDVFISYSHKDEPWASELAESLKAEGVQAWYDQAQIAPGDRISDKIGDALRESRIVIQVVSPESLQSPWTFFELGAALGDNKIIIPVLRDGVAPDQIPAALRNRKWLNESSAQAAGKRVAEVLAKSVNASTAVR
jgi:hypothetical protein